MYIGDKKWESKEAESQKEKQSKAAQDRDGASKKVGKERTNGLPTDEDFKYSSKGEEEQWDKPPTQKSIGWVNDEWRGRLFSFLRFVVVRSRVSQLCTAFDAYYSFETKPLKLVWYHHTPSNLHNGWKASKESSKGTGLESISCLQGASQPWVCSIWSIYNLALILM